MAKLAIDSASLDLDLYNHVSPFDNAIALSSGSVLSCSPVD